ncbi:MULTISPECIES: hypothetical protein [Nocardia]|uniref:hypothetical protein n=1 Tax=Nocardia TaxID=1817 RepID=UPI0024564AFA|nr:MULTISPECIES: hypothetical protein [Nocardia]
MTRPTDRPTGVAAVAESTEDRVLRVLVPDHPDLAGQLGMAVDFADALRHANEPDPDDDNSEPWRLPAQLVAPALQAALEPIVHHDWHVDVGRDGDDRHTGITVTHAGVEHMGLYIATATRTQLSLLAAALEQLVTAETVPPSQRTPEQREIAEFAAAWRDAEESGGDAALSAWQTTVRILTLAITTTPHASGDRPARLYTAEGVLTPTPPAEESTPAADTRTLLDRIDTAGGGSVDLDDTGWRAWRRLAAEWHAAIYGARSNDHSTVLSSFAY